MRNRLAAPLRRGLVQLAAHTPLLAGRDRLVRLGNNAAQAGHLVPSLLGSLSGRLWCRYRELKPPSVPLAGATVCLFAHYDRDGLIEEYVVYHLACLRRAGVIPLFISTAPELPAEQLRKIDPYCAAVLLRENLGIDFGSWRTGLLAWPEVWTAESLIFANDSVYGPIGDLQAALDRMARTDCDFWGVTESLQLQPHYQSYFWFFRRSSLQSAAFHDFCDSIFLLRDKDEIIRTYEVGMLQRLRRRGLRGAALVPAAAGQTAKENPTLHRWRQILAAGAPYLKVQLLRDNPHHQPIADWPQVVQARGYDPDLITRHLQRFKAPR
jgi:lipopolysaccharide biosynthesis protein